MNKSGSSAKETETQEVLGEWDNGFYYPIPEDDEYSDDEDAEPSLRSLAEGLCGTGLVRRALKAEHAVEGCFRGAILKAEDRVERLLDAGKIDVATAGDSKQEVPDKAK